MNTLTNNQKVLIAALIGFIIGAGAIWVWTVSNSATREVPQEEQEAAVGNAENEAEETEEGGAAATQTEAGRAPAPAPAPAMRMDNSELVKVTDQKAGGEVVVTATFDAPGWVAIHEDRNGGLGNVLGARWLPAGTHEATVILLRGTTAGATYHAALYNDDGDRQFEYKSGDVNLLDSAKQPVQASFSAN